MCSNKLRLQPECIEYQEYQRENIDAQEGNKYQGTNDVKKREKYQGTNGGL